MQKAVSLRPKRPGGSATDLQIRCRIARPRPVRLSSLIAPASGLCSGDADPKKRIWTFARAYAESHEENVGHPDPDPR